MSFLALDHVQLTMPPGNEPLAISFYFGVLGLEEIDKPGPMRSSAGVWFRSGAVELHLGVEADFHPARKAHPALLVNNLDALADRCQAAGYAITWDDRYPGFRRFYIHDPFGNRIEILESTRSPT